MDPLEEKRMYSYFCRIPSLDLSDYEYHIFLTCATAEELEKDILKRETMVTISKMLGKDLTKWG
jgi:hypothetical protein